MIASSPTDFQPVLDAVAENAARLCGANDAVIRRMDGEHAFVAAAVIWRHSAGLSPGTSFKRDTWAEP